MEKGKKLKNNGFVFFPSVLTFLLSLFFFLSFSSLFFSYHYSLVLNFHNFHIRGQRARNTLKPERIKNTFERFMLLRIYIYTYISFFSVSVVSNEICRQSYGDIIRSTNVCAQVRYRVFHWLSLKDAEEDANWFIMNSIIIRIIIIIIIIVIIIIIQSLFLSLLFLLSLSL